MSVLKKKCRGRFLAVAIMAACTASVAAASESTDERGRTIDKDMLVQIMALHGLDERGAIARLAAEEEATDLYRRVRSMDLPAYAGAWFDVDSGRLQVALSDHEQAGLLTRLGALPVMVKWSLGELKEVQARIAGDTEFVRSGLLRALHIDYELNQVVVGATPGSVQAVRERLVKYSDWIDVRENATTLEFSTSVRGGDGFRNYDFEQDPSGSGYYPCSVGAPVENGFYTAGHCGDPGQKVRWAATYAHLGDVTASSYEFDLDTLGDIGWVDTAPGWTPVAQINAYGNGFISVPAKWAGTNEAPIGTSVCRYGQTSGGPHCGTVNAVGKTLYIEWYIAVANTTEVNGGCSSSGDSGGPWLSASGAQIQGTNIGGNPTGTCPQPAEYTYFQPISDHISAYAEDLIAPAGSLLTSHGAAAPTVNGVFLCPDMNMSGSGTFYCSHSYQHYNSQGVTSVNWSGWSFMIKSDTEVFGTCTAYTTPTVTFTITNPYGSYSQTKTFACPMGPIP